MSTDSKTRRQCIAVAKKVYKERQQQQQHSQAAQEVAHYKGKIYSKLEEVKAERERYVLATVGLRRTDPESAQMMIARGAAIDAAIRQANKSLAMADSLGIERLTEELIDSCFTLMYKLQTEPIRFRTPKELKKLEEEVKMHSIMQELAQQSHVTEWDIYTDQIGSGAGSTFEEDVRAAERQAEIETIDD